MNIVQQRAKNALMGLAIGDAIGWSSMFHRTHLLPEWTRRLRREIDIASDATGVIGQALPFTLNRNADAMLLGPTDDTEWMVFSATILLENRGIVDEEILLSAWKKLAMSDIPVRGRTSVHGALRNLRKGLLPPATGHDNPGYNDDAAACRSVPFGILGFGRPNEAAATAALDARITNSEEGVAASQAMAAAIALACGGADLNDVIGGAISQVPSGTWMSRNCETVRTLAVTGESLSSSVVELADNLVNREFNSGSLAPETVPLALGIVKLSQGNFERAITASTLVSKTADSVPALVGAIAGALTGTPVSTPYWSKRLSVLKGICLPQLAGKDYGKFTDDFAALAIHGQSPSQKDHIQDLR